MQLQFLDSGRHHSDILDINHLLPMATPQEGFRNEGSNDEVDALQALENHRLTV